MNKKSIIDLEENEDPYELISTVPNKNEIKSAESKSEASPVELCAWCDTPLGGNSHYKASVCVRCYKLLKGAGLTDEQIIKDKTKDTDKHLLDIVIKEVE
jgi:hypothetical protein